jgi:hypothetical protein
MYSVGKIPIKWLFTHSYHYSIEGYRAHRSVYKAVSPRKHSRTYVVSKNVFSYLIVCDVNRITPRCQWTAE